ncbi:unnamed protein product [Discula destructiva]
MDQLTAHPIQEVHDRQNTTNGHKSHGIRSTLESVLNKSAQNTHFLHLRIRDHIKTFVLISLSLAALPLSLTMAYLLSKLPVSWISYLLPLSTHTPAFAAAYRQNCRAQPGFREKTVLVTGINMTKGLTLARAFYLAGHRVVGADFDVLRSSVWLPQWLGLGARQFSRAFQAVYTLEKPVYTGGMSSEAEHKVAEKYVADMIKIMEDEVVDLWVSCSGVASAMEDGMVTSIMGRKRGSRARKFVQFDEETTKKFHEKSSFVQYMQELNLSVPETHEVVSQAEACTILMNSVRANNGRKFILKPVGMNDAHRGNMTLLPLSIREGFLGQATEEYVHKLPISKEQPWILQQFISGNREYCTHALVVDGDVKVFAACPSSEMLMHYKALSHDDPLRKEMLSFTKSVARAEKHAGRSFTGHLSFDFMVEQDASTAKTQMYAIECNPRAHTAVALFATPGAEMRQMVDAYMSIFEKEEPEPTHPEYKKWHLDQLHPPRIVRPPMDVRPRYWLGHDLVALVFLPLLKLLIWPFSAFSLVASIREFVEHVLFWKEGVFELWDPWPFVALYHVYWPTAILQAWWGGHRWSRANVSTTKMFAC